MDLQTYKRLLRRAGKHCPAPLAKQIESAIGPQPDETLSREVLVECLIEAVDARDIGDAVHYSQRILDLDGQLQ
jgi:hypothetical protein